MAQLTLDVFPALYQPQAQRPAHRPPPACAVAPRGLDPPPGPLRAPPTPGWS